MSRRAIAFAVLVVAVGTAGWLARRALAGDGREWAVVERGDLALTVEVAGVLEAQDSASLGPPQIERLWEFKVSYLAPEGAEVEAGTRVLAFDTSELLRQLEQRRNEGEKAAKDLEKRETDLARRREDLRLELAEAEGRERRLRLAAAVPPELVAALEADEVSLDLRLASLEVAHLSAKLALDERRAKAEIAALVEARQRAFGRVAELEAAIARMTVVAPRSGTVVYATDEDRDKVKLGDSVWAGRAVLSIPDLARMVGAGKVDEADAGRLAPGQAVRFFLDAYPGSELHCRVGEVGTSVSARTPGSPVKEVSVRIDLEETDPRRMRPGMRWRGSIETELLAQVLTIPADAVTRTGSGPRVVRRRGLVVERVEPRLGRFWAGRVVVLSGLAEGDRVLRGGEGGRR